MRNPLPTYAGKPVEDLIHAAEIGDTAKVAALLDGGADVNAVLADVDTALTTASRMGKPEVVRLLLDRGAVVNQITPYNGSALMAAAGDGSREIVRLLIERGADVNARTGTSENNLDETVLMFAAMERRESVVEELLAQGADINQRNRFGETALMLASIARSPRVIKLLARNGADVHAVDTEGRSALMLAGDDRETINTLLSLGANFRIRDHNGMTALMIAVDGYLSSNVDALIEAGAGMGSIEATMELIATHPTASAYQILSTLYVRLGLKKEAVNARLKAIKMLGDTAELRALLGSTYLEVGDRASAFEQYRILKMRARAATDEKTKKTYESWADGLLEELKGEREN